VANETRPKKDAFGWGRGTKSALKNGAKFGHFLGGGNSDGRGEKKTLIKTRGGPVFGVDGTIKTADASEGVEELPDLGVPWGNGDS